jgi:hypothetical protein
MASEVLMHYCFSIISEFVVCFMVQGHRGSELLMAAGKQKEGQWDKKGLGKDVHFLSMPPVTCFFQVGQTTYFLPSSSNVTTLWIHQGINPLISSEPSWSNHLQWLDPSASNQESKTWAFWGVYFISKP